MILYRRKRGGTLLLPALVDVQGHNTGGDIVAAAAGLALLQDTAGSGTAPALASGFTSILTQANSAGDNDTSMRISRKVVAAGDTIPGISGGSRRIVRIYSGVDAVTPIADAQSAGGTGASINVPALTMPDGGRLVVGFLRRSGAVVLTFGPPLDQHIYTQNTSAIATSGQSNGLLSSYAGQTITAGTNTDWVVAAIALNGA